MAYKFWLLANKGIYLLTIIDYACTIQNLMFPVVQLNGYICLLVAKCMAIHTLMKSYVKIS